MAAGTNQDELFEHIIKLAQAIGIDIHEERIIIREQDIKKSPGTAIKVDKKTGRIIKRKLEQSERPIKSKIGGFIEDYFHHAESLIQKV